jgi:hypothetical protein
MQLSKAVAKAYVQILTDNHYDYTTNDHPCSSSVHYGDGIRLNFTLGTKEYRIYNDGTYKSRDTEWV